MIDFSKFFSGKIGIIVKTLDEAIEIIDACDEECIVVNCDQNEYKKYPFWYVVDGVLVTSKSYENAIEHVNHVFTYQRYAFDYQI